ncbi:MAG: 4-hydroxy-3-polyprenylbenzoate decarboxylase [Tepidanaerobacteraceae bacterium]|nr:4-hydroxy-3-polyprenylbenzoate decarboxylase [Tepidanaerobacteraceae bacterium]
MAYRDLQDFIKALEGKGLLKRIKTEVDPELEITEIYDRVVKSGGPALLFENVKGSSFPLLINAFGTEERMNLALEVKNLDDIAGCIDELVPMAMPEGFAEKLKTLSRLSSLARIFPKKVKKAPCQQIVEEEVDLFKLPILKCWPKDGGRYITLPVVFTKDPVTGCQNMGMYRMQVFDKSTTGMHWHMHKDGAENYRQVCEKIYGQFCRGKSMEAVSPVAGRRAGGRMQVAVALGGDPALIYAATAPLPRNIDEMLFAGFLRNAPVEMVKAKTVDIYVPAHAEFILEGYVDFKELRREGPFGDHTGFYSPADAYPVFHVECITRKKSPIYPATVVGKPVMEDCFLAKATERIFLPLLKMFLPEIVDINLPVEGSFHNFAIVSIKKSYPGHARKVMNALWGMGQMMFTKILLIIDDDTDPHDISRVAWKAFNNVDPERDIIIMRGPLDVLDHSPNLAGYGGKMGIDATRKWETEGYQRIWPEEIQMPQEIKDLVARRWKEYGFTD